MLPLFLTLATQSPAIVRDAFGVPHIQAASQAEAFYQAGYAVAQDRLWQMENSRRVARGKMAEAFGPRFVPSDREVIQLGYTDEELLAQFDRVSPPMKAAFREYAKGVNAWIGEAERSGKLPKEYAENDLSPDPWTELDSAAISIRFLHQFGRGGAGELRNLALVSYLKTRAETKDRVLDVVDDLAWFYDRGHIPTVSSVDDPVRERPTFPIPDRKTSERHLGALPQVGLLELLPAVRIAQKEVSTLVAMSVGAPYKSGSYAIVVGKNRSGTGAPILLTAPQMGFRSPSIVHEMSIQAPGLSLAGMDLPGVPGILIGNNRDVAWGMTSGIADTDDILVYPMDGDTGYRVGERKLNLIRLSRTIKVKGGSSQSVEIVRTLDGPVLLTSRTSKAIFARKASYWNRELESLDTVHGIWNARSAEELDRSVQKATMSFNLFFATRDGDIGYRYGGLVPVRAAGYDPRFPTLASSETAWKGFIPPSSMPHAKNPKGGLLANWNNAPVAWWPNGDTPAWGRTFRNAVLLEHLREPRLNAQDAERAAWAIARSEESWPLFRSHVLKAIPLLSGKAKRAIQGFEGWNLEGSRQAATYQRMISAIRDELFLPITGNFASNDNYRQVLQPTVILNALERRTKVDYLRGRKPEEVMRAALEKAADSEGTYIPSGITVPGEPNIPYGNRGTYIQISELLEDRVFARNVLPPGVAETGPHATDQAPLSRAWSYKPMKNLSER